MNCPSRTEDDLVHPDWNQNPPTFSADLTTRQDLNGIVNARTRLDTEDESKEAAEDRIGHDLLRDRPPSSPSPTTAGDGMSDHAQPTTQPRQARRDGVFKAVSQTTWKSAPSLQHLGQILLKYSKFVGPGFMVSVAYIDPGNYSTDVAAGAAERFKLLFIVLMSNVFAILLQSLAVRLGTVTGLNLAEHCRAHLPRWLNISLYILGEGAIIATDIAEVCYKSSFAVTRINSALGNRLSNSSQLTPPHPTSRRLRPDSCGCFDYLTLLQSRWIYASATSIRDLRRCLGSWSGNLLLYPAISDRKYLCPRGLPRVLTILDCRARRGPVPKLWYIGCNCDAP